MSPAAFQPDGGARHQVPDGAGDEDLARVGERGDPRPGVDRDAPDLTRGPVFHFAGVRPRADGQAEGAAPSRTLSAQPIARAGLSNRASAPSPAVSTSRPW